MKTGSKEFYDLLAAFERDLESSTRMMPQSRRTDREDIDMWPRGIFYQCGEVNNLFLAFMSGYQLAKAKARIDDLPLDG